MGTAYFSFIKPDPVSDSWIEGITASIIFLLMSTGALSGGGGSSGLMGSFYFPTK